MKMYISCVLLLYEEKNCSIIWERIVSKEKDLNNVGFWFQIQKLFKSLNYLPYILA